MTKFEEVDGVLVPTTLVAVTTNSYVVPSVSPATVVLTVELATVAPRLGGLEVTV
jgi:hypothetical protein